VHPEFDGAASVLHRSGTARQNTRTERAADGERRRTEAPFLAVVAAGYRRSGTSWATAGTRPQEYGTPRQITEASMVAIADFGAVCRTLPPDVVDPLAAAYWPSLRCRRSEPSPASTRATRSSCLSLRWSSASDDDDGRCRWR
jgi:hypothetical protein